MPIKLICPICGNTHKRSPSEKSHICCSNKCGQRLRFVNILKRYPKYYYIKHYIKNKISFRQLEKKTNISISTLRKIFKEHNIPIRHGSEAIKTQWINNDKRRKDIGNLFKKYNPNRNKTKIYKAIQDKIPAKWSKDVRKRDNYICQKCSSNVNVHAHHIKDIVNNPELTNDINNGITLCAKCHNILHFNNRIR